MDGVHEQAIDSLLYRQNGWLQPLLIAEKETNRSALLFT